MPPNTAMPGAAMGIITCQSAPSRLQPSIRAARSISSVVASQMDTHGRYGGVVPELASREHLKAIVPVVTEAMERAARGGDGRFQ